MKKGNPRLLHKGAAALFHEENGHQQLMSSLGYQFKDLHLLRTALTHPSAQTHCTNQRMEFLGDAVLQLAISQALYEESKQAEGQLTFMRQRLVNEQALADIARDISLGDHLLLGNAFFQEGGAEQDSVLADAMEAVLAAVYLDSGFEVVRQVILALWDITLIKQTDAGLDAKGALQAYLQAKGESEPDYRDVSEAGPPHKRIFTAAVFHNDLELAQAQGKTKRIAQQQAAEKALLVLKSREGANEADQA